MKIKTNWKTIISGFIGLCFGGPLGAIIGFVLGNVLFSDDDKSESHNNGEKKNEESNFKHCILILLGEVMNANGKQMSCELDRVKATIRRYYKTEAEQKAALKEFQTILNNRYNIESVCSSINKRLNYIAKSELIMELLAVAYADDDFEADEESIIKRIVRDLNITSGEYKSIYMLFMKKYKQGYYNSGDRSQQSSYSNTNNNSYSNQNNSSNQNSYNRSNNSGYNNSSNNSNNKSNYNSNNYRRSSDISVNDAYDILGVAGNASNAEIKKAYRVLAVKYHPDNAAALGDEAVRQATESMKKINAAWEVLKEARGIK